MTITIALDGATFSARFVPAGEGFGLPGVPGTMVRTGPTPWRLRPPAAPGPYLVFIAANVAQGDLTYIFRWTVPAG